MEPSSAARAPSPGAASDAPAAPSPEIVCTKCQLSVLRAHHPPDREYPNLCARCVAKEKAEQTARRNESSDAIFAVAALERPMWQGENRWVTPGKYKSGPRKGEGCVCKWFKGGHTRIDEYFINDIEAMHKAVEIVQSWNRAGYIEGKPIKVNVPEVWTFRQGCKYEGYKALLEPFIKNYMKFNSNSGWEADQTDATGEWPKVMAALSHFSFHTTKGKYLLCDLQGGITNSMVILTDPVILSHGNEYGFTDLGEIGISNWFTNHICNQYCDERWIKPKNMRQHFAYRQGTSMTLDGGPARDYQHNPRGGGRDRYSGIPGPRQMGPPPPRKRPSSNTNDNNHHHYDHNPRPRLSQHQRNGDYDRHHDNRYDRQRR